MRKICFNLIGVFYLKINFTPMDCDILREATRENQFYALITTRHLNTWFFMVFQ